MTSRRHTPLPLEGCSGTVEPTRATNGTVQGATAISSSRIETAHKKRDTTPERRKPRRRPDPTVQFESARIAADPIRATQVKPSLHEVAEGLVRRPIYEIEFRGRSKHRWSWILSALRAGRGSTRRFVKVHPERLHVPSEVAYKLQIARETPGVDEIAVFFDTRLGDAGFTALLAVRCAEGWFALQHWRTNWLDLQVSRYSICSA